MDLLGVLTTLSPLLLATLLLTSFLTAAMTAALGIGGGVLLLAVMATVLPVEAIIPVHGLVQLGSNGNRAWMTRQHLDHSLFRYFALGVLPGAALATLIVVQLPLEMIQLTVALFILFLVWGRLPPLPYLSPMAVGTAGAVTTLISAFVGATGPLVAALVHTRGYDKLGLTATLAACMTVQHGVKLLVFTLVGFVFSEWLALTLLMILCGTAGTWLGLRLLRHIPSQQFHRLFKLIVSLLALRLLWQAGTSLL